MFNKSFLQQSMYGTSRSFSNYFLPLSSALLITFAPGFAQAQANLENSAQDIEEMVVVGSRIRQFDLKTIAPVKMVARDSAAAAGLNSTTDLLQSATITGGSSQINNAYGAYVTDGGPGANTISLRGLGAGRTLVLINGRRVAPAGTRGAVGSADLNVLPTAMIERVEILRDGASSVYGSDAIGGVVNVITQQEVEGLTIEGEYNHPTEGNGEQARFSLSGGKVEERWSLSGSLDYYERSDLTLADRDWTRCNVDGLRDPETGESLDFIDPNTGKPKCYPITGTGSNGVSINTLGLQTIDETNYAGFGLSAPPVGAAGSSGSAFNRFRPNAGVTTGVPGYEGVGGGSNSLNVRDTFEPRMLNENLISPVKVYTGFIQGKFDLQALGDAEVYVELLAHRRQSEQTGYRQSILDYRRGSPAIPAELSFANFSPDQGTSDGNRVGARAFIGFGNDKSEQTVEFYKPTVGLKGDLTFMPDWRYDIYASYSKSDASYLSQSFFIDKLTYASDVVAAPSTLDASLVSNGLTCQINLTDPDERCIANPPLTAAVSGNLPQNFRDYVFRDILGQTEYEETIYSAIFDGPLFAMPAGSAQGVFGLEYREANINDQPDPQSVSGNLYNLSSAAPTKGRDNVAEAYTEIELPLLADIRFAEELTLNASFRYTDYDSYGSDNTYKVGMLYSPTNWLSLRATQGTSFRAPALYEQFQGPTSGFRSAAGDPCNEYGGPDVSATVAANCASELPGQPDFLAVNGIEVFSQGGAAAGLFAETSKNLTYGIILQPEIDDQTALSFAVDYFDIEINDGVNQAGPTEILDRCYSDPEFRAGGGLCRLVVRDPVTNQLTVSDAYTNLATQVSRGIDFTLNFNRELGPGNLLVDLSVTRYYSQSEQLFADDEVEELNGILDWPEFSGGGDISYTFEQWRLSYGLEWIGSMDSYKYEEEDPATSELDLHVSSYFEHRISIRYKADSWKATFGVRNLTNETPPTISALTDNRVGNSPLYSGYDYVGRELFVNFQVSY